MIGGVTGGLLGFVGFVVRTSPASKTCCAALTSGKIPESTSLNTLEGCVASLAIAADHAELVESAFAVVSAAVRIAVACRVACGGLAVG